MHKSLKMLIVTLVIALASQLALAATLVPIRTGIFSRSNNSLGLGSNTSVTYSSDLSALNFTAFPSFGGPSRTDIGFAIFDLGGLSAISDYRSVKVDSVNCATQKSRKLFNLGVTRRSRA